MKDEQVGVRRSNLVDGVLGEQSLRLLCSDGGVDDDIVAFLPVDRSCNTVLVADLES